MEFEIVRASRSDIQELYDLQLLSFESEAEMIGNRDIPALQETKDEFEKDFSNWITFKLIDRKNTIIGAIRCKKACEAVEIGRLMVHPEHRRKGLAQRMLKKIEELYPKTQKELYTCTKSWANIKLYEKSGYRAYKERADKSGQTFVYMKKP